MPIVDEELFAALCPSTGVPDTASTPAAPWSDCRLLDISLTGAEIELPGELPVDGGDVDHPFFLQIDTIAEDQVGITMRAVFQDSSSDDAGDGAGPEIVFNARREERLLLTLLVRLHTFV